MLFAYTFVSVKMQAFNIINLTHCSANDVVYSVMWYLSNLFHFLASMVYLVANRFINCNRLASQELCNEDHHITRFHSEHNSIGVC